MLSPHSPTTTSPHPSRRSGGSSPSRAPTSRGGLLSTSVDSSLGTLAKPALPSARERALESGGAKYLSLDAMLGLEPNELAFREQFLAELRARGEWKDGDPLPWDVLHEREWPRPKAPDLASLNERQVEDIGECIAQNPQHKVNMAEVALGVEWRRGAKGGWAWDHVGLWETNEQAVRNPIVA